MLTLRCKLTYQDGREVTGTIEAKSPGVAHRINYTGASGCLDTQPDKGSPSDLELLFRMAAQHSGATLAIERTGEYESRTEFIKRQQDQSMNASPAAAVNQTPRVVSVLIADDMKEDRFLLKQAIGSHAPQLQVVGEVTDGGQVTEYLSGKGEYADRRKHPLPDLLILDLRMPGKDGFEVLEWLQRHPAPHMKVAVRADSSGIAYRAEALAMGANYFLSKLATTDQLADSVKQLQNEILSSRQQPGAA